MSRVSERDIEQALHILNGCVEKTGYKVVRGGRYGYQALDLYKMVPGRAWGDCMSTIRCGMTKAECLMVVSSMLDGISIYKRGEEDVHSS